MTTETEGAADAVVEDAPAIEGADTSEVQAEGAEAEAGEDTPATEEAPKPKKTAQERINEVVAKQKEAEREAEYWRSKALQPQQTPPTAQAQPTEDQEPKPDDYTHGELDAAFIRDHATFHANKAFEARLQRYTADQAAQQAQAGWEAKQAAASVKYPDYQEKVVGGAQRNAWPCTPDMNTAIRESDIGPELAYHLASNPVEARRIADLSPHSQIRELGKLEAKLATPAAPKPKTLTDAPEPPQSLRGNGGKFQAAPDTSDFAAFERTYGG